MNTYNSSSSSGVDKWKTRKNPDFSDFPISYLPFIYLYNFGKIGERIFISSLDILARKNNPQMWIIFG